MWQKILLFTFLISFILLGNSCSNSSGNETKGGLENLEEAASDANRLKNFSFDKLDDNLEVVTIKDEYHHTLEYSRNKSDYARQGLFLRKDSLGRLLEAANYLNDTLHGSRILFFLKQKPNKLWNITIMANFTATSRPISPVANWNRKATTSIM